MKFPVDTNDIARRLEKLAAEAGKHVRNASEAAAPMAEAAAKRAGEYAGVIRQKMGETLAAAKQRIQDAQTNTYNTTAAPAKEPPAPADKPNDAQNNQNNTNNNTNNNTHDNDTSDGAQPDSQSKIQEPVEMTLEFDRMAVDRDDSLTTHREELHFAPKTTATELLAALMEYLPKRSNICWIVRARSSADAPLANVGYVLYDNEFNPKPVSLVGEATIQELSIHQIMGIFRKCGTFHLGEPSEADAVEGAIR